MKALLAKLAAAYGGDRDLDAAIAVAVTQPIHTADDSIYARLRDPGHDASHPGHYFLKSRSGAQAATAPFYTSNLDAALTLVPEGAGWNVNGNAPLFYASVKGHTSKAPTPALALCIAALMARQETA